MPAHATILKQAAPLPSRRIPAPVHEAHLRGRAMVAAAEAEVQRILADAEASRAQVLAEAAAEGHALGLARAAGRLIDAAAERDRLLASVERDVASLAVELARRILGDALAVAPGAVEVVATRALDAVRARREVMLRVHPADAATLRGARDRLGARLAVARLELREDPEVARGGVVVETEAGRLDASIETQLSALARALEEQP